MLSIPLFSFIGLAIAQSNGTIGYVEPDTNTGRFGSNIGMAISQDLNTFDDNVIHNDSYIPQPIRGSMGSNFQTNEVSLFLKSERRKFSNRGISERCN